MADDTKAVLKALQQQGFDVRRTTKGHWVIRKNGQHVTVMAGTGSDWRGLRNAIAAARRQGFRWPR